jgi:glycosyltransferase involved in cell wall biosynthesis
MSGGEPPPQISVIVPAYNAERTIGQCLRSLERQTVPRERYEVIVVDDGSNDGTAAEVAAFPGVQLVTQPNAGPAAARNLGVQHARGDLVLFTDADCVPAEAWIERITAPFDDPEIVGTKGTYLTRQRALVARFVQIEYEDKYDRMAKEEYIDFVDTYSAAYRRKVFMSNGGFDVAFPTASTEDQELSFRMARQGYKMVFVPQARVVHLRHAETAGAYWAKKLRIGYWRVAVHQRHRGKLLRDSHTPQTMKLQILVVGLGCLSLVGALFFRWMLWISGAMVLTFALTTVPFTVKAWGRDRLVAIVSPSLLFIRSLALGAGFVAGVVARLVHRVRRR